MGQFSWITQDEGTTVRDTYSCRDPHKTSAYMHDNAGDVWYEPEYEGYGVFGGKDYYELLAEMNGVEPPKGLTPEAYTDCMRSKGIGLAYGKDPFISPNITREPDWVWIDEEPPNAPNQGWEDDTIENLPSDKNEVLFG